MRFDRPNVSLDGEWSFVPDPERLYSPTDLPEGQPITVPACWESQVERPYRIITAWYRRAFDAPAGWEGRPALVRFEAVMYRCRAWLNGTLIGEHEGGYTPFTFAARDALRAGAANVLVVEVVNPLNAIAEYPVFAVDRMLLAEEWVPDLPLSQAPHGKQTWYSSQSGIWRSVRVELCADVHFEIVRVVPDVANGRAELRWRIASDPGAGVDSPLHIEARVSGPDEAEVTRRRVELPSLATNGAFELNVPEPVLWDIDQPNLYEVSAVIIREGDEIDRVSVRFGMRSIEKRDGQILLNGRPIYLLGALDQDLYPDSISTPPSRELLKRQFRLAREMGFNLLRCHVKVPDPAYLDVADETGILIWAELPNWSQFSTGSAARGRRTLAEMVDAHGNHPSVVIWTIINEDWGTDLRHEARDRHWLRATYEWLKDLDGSRLVVDNSACETPQTPNFHVRTDLADFHVYFVSPDNAVRWRTWVNEFASRPSWLWSPHGDAEPQGDEPLVLSEFGSWGLPRLDRLLEHYGRQPWWFGTGLAFYRPSGLRRRFVAYGLDRIWPSVDALAEATQWHQFENLQFEIGELRRHPSIQGYVITEFTDANWEANGVLDVTRGPKVYHERLRQVNAPDAVFADVPRRDLWAGSTVDVTFRASSYGSGTDGGPGHVAWALELDGERREGRAEVLSWPRHGVASLEPVTVELPDVGEVADARLSYQLVDGGGAVRASDELRLAVLPRRTSADGSLSVAVHDPMDVWAIDSRITDLGHRIVDWDAADVLIASGVDERILEYAERGRSVLVLVRTRGAVPDTVDLNRRVSVHLRRLPHAGWPGQRSPWEGDWVTNFNWILPDSLDGLPRRDPLDFAYEEVLPDHVLLGYDPGRHRDEVTAGMFVGWVHAPAAIEWTFPQGTGSITLTTFRLSPESGPVASHLLQRLIRRAANRGR